MWRTLDPLGAGMHLRYGERAGIRVRRVPLSAPCLRAVVDRQPRERLAPGRRMTLRLSLLSPLSFLRLL